MASSRRKHRGLYFQRRLLFLIAITVALCGLSCSRQSRYEVLTFFFTGVPPLEGEKLPAQSISPQQEGEEQQAGAEGVPTTEAPKPLQKHPPFAEGNCEACHNLAEGNRLFEDPCFRCHEDFAKTYRWVHGPAAVGFCNTCHEPHQSKNEFLLISTSREVCFKCHVKEDVFSRSYHEGVGDKVCFDCHNPHGGSDRRFLKEDVPRRELVPSEDSGRKTDSSPEGQDNP